MGVVTKAALKSYFETGDKPTQAQFEELIDTLVANGTKVPNEGKQGVLTPDVNITCGNSKSTVPGEPGGSAVINLGTGTGGQMAGDFILNGKSGSGGNSRFYLNHSATGAEITVDRDGHIYIKSPTGITIENTTTGDAVTY